MRLNIPFCKITASPIEIIVSNLIAKPTAIFLLTIFQQKLPTDKKLCKPASLTFLD